MTITIEVSAVSSADALLPHETFRAGVERALGAAVEACGGSAERLTRGTHEHPFLAAAFLAFQSHYPLTLRPDDLWLLLTQGLAMHVKANSEKLRPRFVAHEGQVELQVRRDDFVPGDPGNPWPEVFAEFSAGIERLIGRKRDLIVADFSTTGPAERAASEIVLLDAMQRYVRYTIMTLCGIPRINLEGTLEDWRSVRTRARNLGEFGLEAWSDSLDRVLEKIVESVEGRPDREFWQSFYRWQSLSGGDRVTGWVNVLFPYLECTPGVPTHNPYSLDWKGDRGPTTDEFPVGLSKAPFVWQVLHQRYAMEFLGGFVGVSQDPQTLALRPEIGWAVRPAPAARSDGQDLASGLAVEFVGPSPAVEEALDHLRATYGAEWIDPEDRRAGFEVRGDEPPLRVLGRASGVAPAGVVLVLAPGPDQDWSLVGEACEELERSLIKAGRLHTTPTRALSGPMPVSDEGFVTEPTGLPPAFLQLLHAARFCDDLAPAGEVLREIRSEVLGNR